MSGKIRFGVYELDRDAMELRKHGVPIRLQEQTFRVLAILAERPGDVLDRMQSNPIIPRISIDSKRSALRASLLEVSQPF
jgi:hypothetical protein